MITHKKNFFIALFIILLVASGLPLFWKFLFILFSALFILTYSVSIEFPKDFTKDFDRDLAKKPLKKVARPRTKTQRMEAVLPRTDLDAHLDFLKPENTSADMSQTDRKIHEENTNQ